MQTYKTRPGVVLTEICGEYLLVSAKKVRDKCPYLTQINESSALLWRELDKGASVDSLFSAVNEEYELPVPDAARAAIKDFIAQMTELGYLLCEEEEDKHE